MDTIFAATLLAVIEEGTIAAAARRMTVTAGTVALRIKALEHEVGAELVARSGRSIVPTDAALRLARPLRDIVAQTYDLKRIASARDVPCGELRLGTIATVGTGTLPALAAKLMQEFPQIDLIVEPGTSLELCSRVADGALDAAIIVQPAAQLRKTEAFDPWFDEPLVLIAPPDTKAQDARSLFSTLPFIRYDRRSRGGRLVDDWLLANDLIVQDRIELDALDSIYAMVSAGLGIAIIPDWRGPRPEATAVKTIALPAPQLHRQIGLYRLRHAPRTSLTDLLTTLFRSLG